MSSLTDTVSALQGRQLTQQEMDALHRFEKRYGLADEDPLNVVLAMLAANQISLERVPELLQQKSMEIIELHRQVMAEQATLIAKNLVVTVGNMVAESNVGQKLRLAYIGLAFFAGSAFAGLVAYLLTK